MTSLVMRKRIFEMSIITGRYYENNLISIGYKITDIVNSTVVDCLLL